MKKSLKDTLNQKTKKLLSLYYTMGYPFINRIDTICSAISQSRQVDFLELGMPYSDPLADGETIQMSSSIAIKNGMNLEKYFQQASAIHKKYALPLVYMGYYNAIFQLGMEKFCHQCQHAGIEGVIIPDMPLEIFEEEAQQLFYKYGLLSCFLVTPTTDEARIRKIESLTTGFIYVVSGSSITGKTGRITDAQLAYYQKIKAMKLSKPTIIGFGIHDRESYLTATAYADGAIVGSEFIRLLSRSTEETDIIDFINSIKN